jgi:hypothetical protein
MVVDVKLEPTFDAGKPRTLLEALEADMAFDVSPDGRRFLMVRSESVPPPQINYVANWVEALRREKSR